MPSGGARLNAGAKKGLPFAKTLKKRMIRERIQKFVEDNLDPLLQAQLERALGCPIIDKKDDTGERIYDLPPSADSAKLLIEHAAGKAPQSIDITSKGESLKFLTDVEVMERIEKLK